MLYSYHDEEVINAHGSGYRNGYLIGIECCYYVNITDYMIQISSCSGSKTNNIINLVNSKAKFLLHSISNLPDDDEMEDYGNILSGIRSLCNQCEFDIKFNVSISSIVSNNDYNSDKSLDW